MQIFDLSVLIINTARSIVGGELLTLRSFQRQRVCLSNELSSLEGSRASATPNAAENQKDGKSPRDPSLFAQATSAVTQD